MNMLNWINDLKDAPVKKPLPVLSFPGIQILNMSVIEMVNSAKNQAMCMKAIADRFDCAASVSLMDLSVEAECFGSNIRYSDDEVPTVVGGIVETEEDAQNLIVPQVGAGRTGKCVEALTIAKTLISDRPILAGCIGPFSLSGRLMDMTEIMIKCMVEPEMTPVVLSKATEFIINYALAIKEAGADGLVIAEPAAGLLSPDLCENFSSQYVKKIVKAVSSEDFIVIYHNCGNTLPLLESIKGICANAYHFGNAVDISEVLENMPADVPVMGNLSPSDHFRGGTPESVAQATMEMLIKAKNHTNYIPSSGCDIPPLSPLENIEAFFNTVKEFYK